MASCTTNQKPVSSYPYFTLNVTEDTSYTNKKTTAKLDWVLSYHADYAVSSGAKGLCKVTIDGQEKTTSEKWTYGGKTGTYTVNSGSVYVTRSTSSKTVKFSIWVEWGVSYSGYSYDALTGSGTMTIAAKTSYTVSYNANGGSGAPSSQTKYAGTNLVLSSTKPTRTGYVFSKWNSKSDGSGTNYDPGSEYKSDSAVTLYAIWTAKTYSVSYNNNGGSGTISSQTKTYGVTLKLSSTIPSKNLYEFVTWNTKSDGSGTSYAPGSNYTSNAALTLYAIWKKAVTPPVISNVVVQRCTDSSGSTIDEYNGIYAKIQFSWGCDQLSGVNPAVSVTVNDTDVSSMGGITSGSVTEIRGTFTADTSHNIKIAVTDSYGLVTIVNKSLTSAKYAIDFKAGGTGVAFGKVAKDSNKLDSAWPGYFNGLNVTRSYDNQNANLEYARTLYGLSALTKDDNLSELTTPGVYRVSSDTIATALVEAGQLPSKVTLGGILIVEKMGTLSASYHRQTYRQWGASCLEWVRYISTSSGNTYPWRENTKILVEGDSGGWHYVKWSSGRIEAWCDHYDNGNSIPADSVTTWNVPVPSGIFSTAPIFASVSIVSNTDNPKFGMVSVAVKTMQHRTATSIPVILCNAHTSGFAPAISVYAVSY